jgi:hypothetical protein
VAIRDAFDTARRKLKTYLSNRRGEVKLHSRNRTKVESQLRTPDAPVDSG